MLLTAIIECTQGSKATERMGRSFPIEAVQIGFTDLAIKWPMTLEQVRTFHVDNTA